MAELQIWSSTPKETLHLQHVVCWEDQRSQAWGGTGWNYSRSKEPAVSLPAVWTAWDPSPACTMLVTAPDRTSWYSGDKKALTWKIVRYLQKWSAVAPHYVEKTHCTSGHETPSTSFVSVANSPGQGRALARYSHTKHLLKWKEQREQTFKTTMNSPVLNHCCCRPQWSLPRMFERCMRLNVSDTWKVCLGSMKSRSPWNISDFCCVSQMSCFVTKLHEIEGTPPEIFLKDKNRISTSNRVPRWYLQVILAFSFRLLVFKSAKIHLFLISQHRIKSACLITRLLHDLRS